MAITLIAKKMGETDTDCTYVFGPPGTTVGTVRVERATGDIELVELSETDDGPGSQFFLAQVVLRLQSYHDEGAYPDQDRWPASA